ncbi:peptide-methionine (S)-S-oxide reductase [Gelidibacter salicanalis]|uniref:peptide-methionine (S)-S-oxide reductase n=1 Tax=Gelidibacter salicanalis TaxID=291193 RepID=A0A934KUB7_9FLAO|nr:peptide-methionine (S)-S-oxide reductase [Gelidibacter salicanalis]MBJ7882170.1 peptide-methionine (S)-S-oxide reductase [Gelidibacter salicanalis]
MTPNIIKIGFGGGCHWCTEAVFQSVKGVEKVEQGYVTSTKSNSGFSEAVIVHFNIKCVTLTTLIEIHLFTHKSKSDHSMRGKYRSAIYTFNNTQHEDVVQLLKGFQIEQDQKFITQVLLFQFFEPSRDDITNYYYKNPKKPFCETYINPKLKVLLQQFSEHVDQDKVIHLKA